MAEWVLVLSFIFYGPARRKVPRFYGPDGLMFLWGSTDRADTLYSGAAQMDVIRSFTDAHFFLFWGQDSAGRCRYWVSLRSRGARWIAPVLISEYSLARARKGQKPACPMTRGAVPRATDVRAGRGVGAFGVL
jgi:hypothetical protein